MLLIRGLILINKPTLLIAPNGGRIYSYGDSLLRLAVADTYSQRREADVWFLLYNFNLNRVDIILGHPWLT